MLTSIFGGCLLFEKDVDAIVCVELVQLIVFNERLVLLLTFSLAARIIGDRPMTQSRDSASLRTYGPRRHRGKCGAGFGNPMET